MTEGLNKQSVQKEETEEEPIVYAIQKDLKGWKFSRRDFLKGAVITAEMAAVVGAVAGCGGSDESAAVVVDTPTATSTPTSTNTPTPTATDTLTSTPQTRFGDTMQAKKQGDTLPTRSFSPTPTNTPIPECVVQDSDVNIRGGPGTNYNIVQVLNQGAVLQVFDRNSESSWLKVRTAADEEGWIAEFLVECSHPIEDIPIETNIPTPPPTNTPTPDTRTPEPTPTLSGVKGTVAPGQEGSDYTYTDEYGVVHTYTMPCGSPIPPGAVCVCNCVTGRACMYLRRA